MGADGLIWLSAALAIAGAALLRVSWGMSARALALNLAGWSAMAAAVAVAARAAGAWGIAVTGLVAIGAAFVALAFSARKPAGKGRAKRARTSHRGREEMHPTNRSGWLTFAIAGPLALGACVLLALAARALILVAGGAEADGNVAVLATVPVAWPILSFALLMMTRRGTQFGWVLGIAAASAPFLLLQGGPT